MEVVDHGRVPTRLVVGIAGRSRADVALDVEIEPIDDGIAPRPGTSVTTLYGTPCVPQEVRKVSSRSVVHEVVVGRIASSNREKDLLAICLLACDDIWPNVRASL